MMHEIYPMSAAYPFDTHYTSLQVLEKYKGYLQRVLIIVEHRCNLTVQIYYALILKQMPGGESTIRVDFHYQQNLKIGS